MVGVNNWRKFPRTGKGGAGSLKRSGLKSVRCRATDDDYNDYDDDDDYFYRKTP
jgi:hypothetical protein